MTTRTELLEIIENGENSGVEFKRDDLRTQDLAKELVAFSNLEGGMVLLGVEDDGSVSELKKNDLEEWVMSVCRDKIRPAIVPFYEVVREVEEGKDVAVVRVPRGYDVHALWIVRLLCMTDLAHASKLKEHDDNDDFQGTTGRAA